MKKIINLLTLILLTNFVFAQEWNSNAPDIIYAENSTNNVNPIRIGIGTNSPATQLHATGNIRFSGLPVSVGIPNFIVGADNDGDLIRFSSDLLDNNNSWLLTGNDGVTPQNFIGTINTQSLRIRTDNVQRMIVTAGGRVGINAGSPATILDTRYRNNTQYDDDIIGNGNWNNSDGLFIYNQDNGGENRFASVILGSVSDTGRLSIAKINSVATGDDESALTFQTENSTDSFGDIDNILERMRITHTGTVQINIQDNDDNELALHTNGNLQFDNIPDGTGRALVLDGNNEVRLAQSIIAFDDGKIGRVAELEDRIAELEKRLTVLAALTTEGNGNNLISTVKGHTLTQNVPNPASDETSINYAIGKDFNDAKILLFNVSGQLINTYPIQNESGAINVDAYDLENGTYIYSLEVDGQILESKKLIKKDRF